MALASISHLHPHRIQTPKDFLLRNTNPLRIPELIRDQARSRQHHPTLHCLAGIDTTSCTQPACTVSACSHDTTRHIELLASIQDSVQRASSDYLHGLVLAGLNPATIQDSVQRASSDYLHGLVLADLDPATAKLAITITGPFLSAFGFLFIARIVMSWYPKLPVGKFPYVVAYAPTEPILSLTRKVIPPLGGVDVTPVVWFGLTSFLSEILVGPQGLLVLLSQQR